MKALLLAAGRGKRAGGPKAWAPHDGHTLLESQLKFLLSRFRPESVFVTIQAEWRERCLELNRSVRWTPADPDAPAFASLKTLLTEDNAEAWRFIHHVDMPVWEPALFDALAAAAANGGENHDALVPVFEGRRGHPVLLSPRAQTALARLDPARARLDRWLSEAKVLEVPGPACCRENWNEGPELSTELPRGKSVDNFPTP